MTLFLWAHQSLIYDLYELFIVSIVSIVVPFGGYLFGSLIQNWLNKKRNYNGDYR